MRRQSTKAINSINLVRSLTPSLGNIRFEYSSGRKHDPDTGKPFRFPLEWGTEEYYNEKALDRETRRIFDVCHGCRLCYNLCESFPSLFDMIDRSSTGELNSVPSGQFRKVVDQCTLCDMCSVGKCPYVPPHPHNIDFPQLVQRHRAVMNKKKNLAEGVSIPGANVHNPDNRGDDTTYCDQVEPGVSRQLDLKPAGLAETVLNDMDRTGAVLARMAPLANAVSNSPATRKLAQKLFQIHPEATLPRWCGGTYAESPSARNVAINRQGRAFGLRKVLLCVNCNPNFNNHRWVEASHRVLAHCGVEVRLFYEGCCGMPKYEAGDLAEASKAAERQAAELAASISDGWDVVSIVPSCTLMMKETWRSLRPRDPHVQTVSESVCDISEYVVRMAHAEHLPLQLSPVSGHVTMHQSCHSRALNLGCKSKEMLALIPGCSIDVVDKCSGHGGSLGFSQKFHDIAVKQGKRAVQRASRLIEDHSDANQSGYFVSDCPLAYDHLKKMLPPTNPESTHPIEIFALSMGLGTKNKEC